MQSLLSAQERHAFQSFLSSMDLIDTSEVHPSSNSLGMDPLEWAMYTNGSDVLLDADEAPSEGREALAKATKDLMALDRHGSWVTQNGLGNGYDFEGIEQHHGHRQSASIGGRHAYTTAHDPFPFLSGKLHQQQLQQQDQGHGMLSQIHHPLSPTQIHQHQHRQGLGGAGGAGGTSLPSLDTNIINGALRHPNSAFALPSPQQHLSHQPLHSHRQQVHIPQHQHPSSPPSSPSKPPTCAAPSSASTANNNKRPRHLSDSSTPASARPRSASSPHAISPSASTPTSSASASAATPTNPSSSASATTNPMVSQQKQALLSPSQKKANHIQSEQKRRANIRRGYEALCETVPALREAIREEEEAERGVAEAVNGNGNATRRVAGKKKRGKKGEGEKDKDKDKIDGRAGPRSENVVLSKTIEHIQHLLADRSALLARLHRARSCLPPGHPALRPSVGDEGPLWEREWRGGEGRLAGFSEEGDEEGGSEDEEG